MRTHTIVLLILGVVCAVFAYLIIANKKEVSSVPEHVENGVVNNDNLPSQDLPSAVEAKRQAIYDAARERNYEKLDALRDKEQFSYSFGGEYEGGFIEYLKLEERDTGINHFDTIMTLLKLPHTLVGDMYYAWPSVFGKSANDWTEEDVAQMKTLVSDDDIQQFRLYGSYTGWRLGITSDGRWVYFIAGD